MAAQSEDPLILHIETSGKTCSVALSEGEGVLGTKESSGTYEHSALLAPYAREILSLAGRKPADLHAVSVSGGPGSYTGLRVGVSLAKAMAYALDIPMVAVDTLECLAWAAMKIPGNEADFYVSNIDARRMEVYCAVFDASGKRLTEDESLIIEEGVFDSYTSKGKVVFCGTGTSKSASVLHDEKIALLPMESLAVQLVEPALRQYRVNHFADIEAYKPKYLKAPNITVPAAPKW